MLLKGFHSSPYTRDWGQVTIIQEEEHSGLSFESDGFLLEAVNGLGETPKLSEIDGDGMRNLELSFKTKQISLKQTAEHTLEKQNEKDFQRSNSYSNVNRDFTFQNKENTELLPGLNYEKIFEKIRTDNLRNKSLVHQLALLSSALSNAHKKIIDLEEKLKDHSEIIYEEQDGKKVEMENASLNKKLTEANVRIEYLEETLEKLEHERKMNKIKIEGYETRLALLLMQASKQPPADFKLEERVPLKEYEIVPMKEPERVLLKEPERMEPEKVPLSSMVLEKHAHRGLKEEYCNSCSEIFSRERESLLFIQKKMAEEHSALLKESQAKLSEMKKRECTLKKNIHESEAVIESVFRELIEIIRNLEEARTKREQPDDQKITSYYMSTYDHNIFQCLEDLWSRLSNLRASPEGSVKETVCDEGYGSTSLGLQEKKKEVSKSERIGWKFLLELEKEIELVEKEIDLEKRFPKSKDRLRDLICYKAELKMNAEREREKLKKNNT